MNFVDPSGRDAGEYVQLAKNSIKTGVTITAVTAVVGRYQLWAIASTVGIIGQHLGLDVHEDQIQTLWDSCAASLNVTNFARDAAFNSLFGFGSGLIGEGVARGIGWLLDDAEQGAELELIPRNQTPTAPRLPQDASVNPTAPDPLPLNRPARSQRHHKILRFRQTSPRHRRKAQVTSVLINYRSMLMATEDWDQ